MLFLGGLRDADVLLAEFDAVGDGVEDILIAASSCEWSDILSCDSVDIFIAPWVSVYVPPNSPVCCVV